MITNTSSTSSNYESDSSSYTEEFNSLCSNIPSYNEEEFNAIYSESADKQNNDDEKGSVKKLISIFENSNKKISEKTTEIPATNSTRPTKTSSKLSRHSAIPTEQDLLASTVTQFSEKESVTETIEQSTNPERRVSVLERIKKIEQRQKNDNSNSSSNLLKQNSKTQSLKRNFDSQSYNNNYLVNKELIQEGEQAIPDALSQNNDKQTSSNNNQERISLTTQPEEKTMPTTERQHIGDIPILPSLAVHTAEMLNILSKNRNQSSPDNTQEQISLTEAEKNTMNTTAKDTRMHTPKPLPRSSRQSYETSENPPLLTSYFFPSSGGYGTISKSSKKTQSSHNTEASISQSSLENNSSNIPVKERLPHIYEELDRSTKLASCGFANQQSSQESDQIKPNNEKKTLTSSEEHTMHTTSKPTIKIPAGAVQVLPSATRNLRDQEQLGNSNSTSVYSQPHKRKKEETKDNLNQQESLKIEMTQRHSAKQPIYKTVQSNTVSSSSSGFGSGQASEGSASLIKPNQPHDSNNYLPEENTDKYSHNPFKKGAIKFTHAYKQKSFSIPMIAALMISTTYISMLYAKNPAEFLNNIMNITNPRIYLPIIITSSLVIISILSLIRDQFKTDTKIPKSYKSNFAVFYDLMAHHANKIDKCIRTMTITLSNNTTITCLDESKYNSKISLASKRLRLTMGKPLVANQAVALLAVTFTFLITKYFDIGLEKLVTSFTNFDAKNLELMVFTSVTAIMALSLVCTFIHTYRKTELEKVYLSQVSPEDNISTNKANNYEFLNQSKLRYTPENQKESSLEIKEVEITHYNTPNILLFSYSKAKKVAYTSTLSTSEENKFSSSYNSR